MQINMIYSNKIALKNNIHYVRERIICVNISKFSYSDIKLFNGKRTPIKIFKTSLLKQVPHSNYNFKHHLKTSI
jgi:hypothetical protein